MIALAVGATDAEGAAVATGCAEGTSASGAAEAVAAGVAEASTNMKTIGLKLEIGTLPQHYVEQD